MKEFFKVKTLDEVLALSQGVEPCERETIPITEAIGRVLAEDIVSDINLPDFARSTVDGYAVRAASTYGASESSPAFLTVKDNVIMGEPPTVSISPGEAAGISTGGMLPDGTDSVVMIEHTEAIDDSTIEVYRGVAPGQNVIEIGEDIRKGEIILDKGLRLRPQELGMLAALGKETASVYRKPLIGIISTGDEVVSVTETPKPGQIRDINTYTLLGLIIEAGGIPVPLGIVKDDYHALLNTCTLALERSDMVLISGGSSVGFRDYTIDVLSTLPDPEILVHGISISPGKPTILAKSGKKVIWGLPGHVVSAMIVFKMVVRPFIDRLSGLSSKYEPSLRVPARLSRNLASAQGRTDYVRVQIVEKEDCLWAEPILGKSGLINTMIKANGLIEIELNTEGLNKGSPVWVIPM
ncbi:MAG: molybdopterin molybdotransferase MoeA [Deltaproteobacteria bacterium]|nr:molybdopterin molybdotransferase MoeA [Deltaproteobacteria bacterium]MBW1959886.1 molybdopterin molybdotransferase MoeA [Deltaproteobacteria bacterium]MBW2150400.1 molybdopterin molybdotransferase MoeA [Deltaproteobacteria bacterium]